MKGKVLCTGVFILISSGAFAEEGVRHKVRGGDTLERLQCEYGPAPEAMLAANPGLKASKMPTGREIVIPVVDLKDLRKQRERGRILEKSLVGEQQNVRELQRAKEKILEKARRLRTKIHKFEPLAEHAEFYRERFWHYILGLGATLIAVTLCAFVVTWNMLDGILARDAKVRALIKTNVAYRSKLINARISPDDDAPFIRQDSSTLQ